MHFYPITGMDQGKTALPHFTGRQSKVNIHDILL